MKRFICILGAAVVAGCAEAQKMAQTVSAAKGWNAVYVGVAADGTADELFAAWPVKSVSAYSGSALLETAADTAGTTGEAVARVPFFLWSREASASSTMSSVMADSVLVFFATNAFTHTFTGVPAAPRIAWHASSGGTLNYVGVLLNGGGEVPAVTYLKGADIGSTTLYQYGGSNESLPRPIEFLGSTVPKFTSGKALLVSSEKISDWSGPLYVSPQNGVAFGTNETLRTLSIRNDGPTNKWVMVAYENSLEPLPTIDLVWQDAAKVLLDSTWKAFTVGGVISNQLAAGESWQISLGLDRSKLKETRATRGGILRITEDGASKAVVCIPLTATDTQASQTLWPAGLWLGEVTLNKVSKWEANKRTDNLKAGGEMKARFILHVDTHGNTKLLQRVTVASKKDTLGNVHSTLYAGGANVPSGYDSTARISSVVLPVDVPVIAPESGAFMDKVGQVFRYRVSASSPSNPFRHHLHPQFDGLKSDFKTAAPSGDNLTNYVGSVKPELFGFDGTVALTWDTTAATAWDPDETLTGTCTWTYTGVRREGPIAAKGAFTMRRILRQGELITQ